MALWSYVVLFMAAQAAHSSDIEADPKIIGDLVNPPVDIGCLLKHCSVSLHKIPLAEVTHVHHPHSILACQDRIQYSLLLPHSPRGGVGSSNMRS